MKKGKIKKETNRENLRILNIKDKEEKKINRNNSNSFSSNYNSLTSISRSSY